MYNHDVDIQELVNDSRVMDLIHHAYHLGWEDNDNKVYATDPRVIVARTISRQRKKKESRKALDEIVDISQDMGLYE